MSYLHLIGDCGAVRAELSSWMDGELGAEQQAAIEQHLAACSDCRTEAALIRLVSEAARQVPRLEPREALRRRVLDQVRAEAPKELVAARDTHRVEIRVIERSGETIIHWQEWGASPAPLRRPAPDLIARPASHARVQWRQQGPGSLTVAYELIEAS